MVVLTGAFLEMAVVTDYDTASETETLIGQTTEDVEIERDPSAIEWQEHSNARTQRKEGFETADASFSMLVTDDQQNMKDAEVIGSDGRVQRNVTHEAVYFHLYERPSDTDPAATYEMLDGQFVIETITFPLEDPAMSEVAVWINGEHGFKQA